MTEAPTIIDRPSPNFGPRRGGAAVSMVVLHYTGMLSAEAAMARLGDPASEVSAHYVVTESGAVFRMVPEEMRAWHAGAAFWGGVTDINSCSIGVEIANPGPERNFPPFPQPQMAALERLVDDILIRHSIPPQRVVGHACIAPGRKHDPGRKFDWRRLAQRGLGIWRDPAPAGGGAPDAARFQAAARRFGYAVPGTGAWCAPTLAAWDAFALRFLPARAGLPPDTAGVAHLEDLADRWPAEPGA